MSIDVAEGPSEGEPIGTFELETIGGAIEAGKGLSAGASVPGFKGADSTILRFSSSSGSSTTGLLAKASP